MAENITKIHLLNIPLENDYKHTYYFSSSEEQLNFMLSKKKHSFENCSYQKKQNMVIRIPKKYDDLINCNYVMYQNSYYSNKWYYAFITDLEDRNDGTCIVQIQLDCIQTYMFEYNVLPSFVEREHVSDDTVGMHILDEGLELGSYVCNKKDNIGIGDELVIVIGVTEAITKDEDGKVTIETTGGSVYNGIYSGIKYYVFPVDNSSSAYTEKITTFINDYAGESKADSIVCMFLAPKFLVNSYTTGNNLNASINPVRFLVNMAETDLETNKVFTVDRTKVNGYTVRNNKLLCYPYRYLYVSNNNGSDVVYHYEDWYTQADRPCFYIEGCISPGCSIRLIPVVYKGVDRMECEGINAGKFPALNWTSDYYTNWLTQNAVNIGTSLVSGAMATAGGIALMATGAGALAGAGATVGGLNSITSTLGEIRKADLVPNQASGNLNCGDVITAGGQNDFIFYDMSIKYQYAIIIDGYFDMFGYKVNMLKTPNTNHRQNYWFTKTIDCNIDGAIPNKDLQVIKDCYNRGITFWRNANEINDYSVDNTI